MGYGERGTKSWRRDGESERGRASFFFFLNDDDFLIFFSVIPLLSGLSKKRSAMVAFLFFWSGG